METWERDPAEAIINDGSFFITNPGPLHAPIQKFRLRRDENFDYVLQTSAAADAVSTAREFPAGTVRSNKETVEFEGIDGARVLLVGVISGKVTCGSDERGFGETREEVRIHRVEGNLPVKKSACYAIDWLANVSGRDFVWPDILRTETETTTTRKLGREIELLTLKNVSWQKSMSASMAAFNVDGTEFYLCATGSESKDDPLRSGCIVYKGVPTDDYRRRIRGCLSFALGSYLVYLGNTTYTEDWHIATFNSVSAYSLDRKVFRLANVPPAPLHPELLFAIDQERLSRIVSALYRHHDSLKFLDLSWAYWHAQCATPHIAAVHFGAAIEALLRRYAETKGGFRTKLVPESAEWSRLRQAIEVEFAKLSIPDGDKVLLTASLSNMNRVPIKNLMKQVLDSLGLRLGEAEKKAWKRRDNAAHGNDRNPDERLELIRDNKLLAILFHRLLLRMTDASDFYYDHYSIGHAIRRLEEPVA